MKDRGGTHIPHWRGYYGKVPVAGDFVSHGLPRSVENVLDDWLRRAIRDSQKRLGRDWLDAFLVTPVWRFALAAGLLGPQPVAGVMMPSVDRVGRYFPLMIAASRPDATGDILALSADGLFYDAAEALVLSRLDATVPFQALVDGLSALPFAHLPQIDPDPEDEAAALWWTGRDAAQTHATIGLPQHTDFSDIFLCKAPKSLAGHAPATPAPLRQPEAAEMQPDHRLTRRPMLVREAPAPDTSPLPQSPAEPTTATLLGVDHAFASLKGTRSAALTDAVSVSGDGQAFSLLSGIGQDAALPAQVSGLVPVLAEIAAPFSMNDLIAEAKGKLGRANTFLTARSATSGQTTAVATISVLVQARRYAVLWAGHCTAWLQRDGTLHPLNRPHVDARLRGTVTRALGVTRTITFDTAIGQAQAGDRFLLLSPGVTHALPPDEIARTLATADTPQMAVTQVTQNALIEGTPLDATALAIFLSPRS
ncbi:type VI secretion system-associated protein TagF [Jannaschia sp. CCS1]|uniref:type VI secretion system-associated protein TagF n=1 Tax=Jannaschia sp. (strain CCS1) TaxID=290400 RepID=UPI000053DD45|nr:type VI secretion system-associated protein TagF [Jannaschia sp. CCS1]ABD55953.1 hypothetical protein Jann_3036 [Jannaschia sp. CCS1]